MKKYIFKPVISDNFKSVLTQNKQKLMSNIYGLFEKYGSTLDNSHGSNLLHRLLLEGRISFKEDVGSFKLTETQANNIIKRRL